VIGPDHFNNSGHEFFSVCSQDSLIDGKAVFLPSKKLSYKVSLNSYNRYRSKGAGTGFVHDGCNIAYFSKYMGRVKPLKFAKDYLTKVNPERTLLTICSDSYKVLSNCEVLSIVQHYVQEGVNCIDYAVETRVNQRMINLLHQIIGPVIKKQESELPINYQFQAPSIKTSVAAN